MIQSLPNPSKDHYEITIHTHELTFMGMRHQPDFAELTVKYIPRYKIIELKSYKLYLYGFRDKHMSYEDIINRIYSDVMDLFDPHKLRVEMRTRPRGGISSKLVVDSEWR